MHRSLYPCALVAILFRSGQAQACGTCQSFGVDFISDGLYFQNSLSTDNFTAVQEFEGCTNDTSHNVLVGPRGTQYECSMTPMSPDDTPEQLTCTITKNEMYSGEWSLLILSNNGDCAPIDYERDFYLSVGPQETTTVSPTIYITSTTTPIENSTVLQSQTITSTAPPSTTTVPPVTLNPTITIRPLPTIKKVTKAIFTITKTRPSASVVATTTTTSKAKCHLPRQRHTADPIASIVATVLGDINSILSGIGLEGRDALPAPTAQTTSNNFKRSILAGRSADAEAKAAFLAARHERLALNKRAPDEPTSTFTEPSASPVLSTIVSTAPTQTILITSTTFLTSTYTPVVTVKRGAEVIKHTITAPRRTLTKTIWTVATTTTTRVQRLTLTVQSVITPSRRAERCSRLGGSMY